MPTIRGTKRPFEKLEIPTIELISEKTSDEIVYELLQQHGELAGFQIATALKMPSQTVYAVTYRMKVKGLIKSRYAMAKVDGTRRKVHLFSVNSQDSQKAR